MVGIVPKGKFSAFSAETINNSGLKSPGSYSTIVVQGRKKHFSKQYLSSYAQSYVIALVYYKRTCCRYSWTLMLKIVLNNTANYGQTNFPMIVFPPPSKKSFNSLARTVLSNLRNIKFPKANLKFVVDVVFGISSRIFRPCDLPDVVLPKKSRVIFIRVPKWAREACEWNVPKARGQCNWQRRCPYF